jgi:hypothetical protein
MKTNRHYAMAMPVRGRTGMEGVENGLRPDQVGKEGTACFIQETRYFRELAPAHRVPPDSRPRRRAA